MDHGPRRSGSIRRRAAALTLICVVAAGLVVALVFRHRNGQRAPLGLPPAAAPRPGSPVFEPSVATRMSLVASPLGVSPDGFARWLVRVRFANADGAPTRLESGGDIAFTPSHGSAQWQTRLRYDGPAAILSTTVDGPLAVNVRANAPLSLPAIRATTNTRFWSGPRASAAPLGPHVVQIGWFPKATTTVRVTRTDERGVRRLALVAPPSSTFRDASVDPGARETYDVAITGRAPLHFSIQLPAEPAHASLAALGGKAMWLSFSPSTRDANNYTKLAAAVIVARASASGIRAIELRTAYGPFSEITPAARPAVDALIDAAQARGIALVAWTVPRGSDYDDLARSVAAAYYRTSRGNGFAAIAVDLERGGDYLGQGPAGFEAIAAYALRLREALGTEYPLIATVEDPYLGHLDGNDYPYAAVAAQVDVLQPMAYWRMMSARANSPEAVRRIVRESYTRALLVAHRTIAINIGGQTAGGGPRGAPPPDEIAAAVRAARDAGALGVTFFDWNGTNDAQWAALARTPWTAAR